MRTDQGTAYVVVVCAFVVVALVVVGALAPLFTQINSVMGAVPR